MPFEPGKSGNKNGRPKGATGKVSGKAREILANLLTAELEALPARLDELGTKDRIEVLIRLLPYGIPKLKALDINVGPEIREPDLLVLSDGTQIEM